MVSGSPGSVFGRPVNLAIGGQYRHADLSQSFSDLYQSGFGAFTGPSRNTAGSSEVKSIFGELSYSVLDNLNLDFALRHEDYGAFNTTNPKFAVNWRVIPQFSIRASASSAFQAPGLSNSTSSQISSGVTNITDPNNGVTTFRTVITDGNPKLMPQTSKNYNIGFTALPVEHLSLSLDYWHYHYDNQIQTQNAQAVINANPNGPQVVRDQNGVAQTIFVTSFNATSGTQTSGLDFAGQYTTELLGVRLNFHDNLSYLLSYDIDTGTLVYNGVGRRNNSTTSPASAAAAPRWRNIAAVDGAAGPHSFSVDVRYISGVIDDYGIAATAKTAARVSSSTLVDLQYGYRFGEDDRYQITLGMINVFDRAPPGALYTGYVQSLEDPYGRQTYVKLVTHF